MWTIRLSFIDVVRMRRAGYAFVDQAAYLALDPLLITDDTWGVGAPSGYFLDMVRELMRNGARRPRGITLVGLDNMPVVALLY